MKSEINQLKSSNSLDLSAKAKLHERAPSNLRKSVKLASERGHPVGLVFFLGRNMDLVCIKQLSMMLLLFDMVGILLDFPSTVLVVFGFLLNIHFLVQKEASHY